MPTTALIAESNRFLSEALATALTILGLTVVGKTSKESDIVALALKTRPNLLVFDYHLAGNGIAGLRSLKHLKVQLPHMKILIIGFHEAADQIAETILNVGFDGFWNIVDNDAGFVKSLKFLFP